MTPEVALEIFTMHTMFWLGALPFLFGMLMLKRWIFD